MHSVIWVVMAVVVVWGLAAQRVPGLVWATVLASAIALWDVFLDPPAPLWIAAWSVFVVVVLPLAFAPLRRVLISALLLSVFKKIMAVWTWISRLPAASPATTTGPSLPPFIRPA